MIPQGFLPDGLARVMALNGVDSAGTITDIYNRMGWVSADAPTMDVDELHNLHEGPVVNPNTNEIINIRNRIYLPSDKFTAIENPIDPGTCWGQHSFIGPSPYGSDGLFNPIYCATAYTGGSINNALADFNGLENTRILCQSAETYVAANAAHSYKAYDGDSLEWYLPSMGELGFIMPRITVIIKALNSINKALSNVYCLWSSTEINDRDACTLIPSEGSAVSDEFGKAIKHQVNSVIPFTRINHIEEIGDLSKLNLNTRIQSYTITKQDKVDVTLITESKNIVGSINEIASYIGLTGNTDAGIKDLVKEMVREYLSGTTNQISLTESGDTLNVGISEDAVFGDTGVEY